MELKIGWFSWYMIFIAIVFFLPFLTDVGINMVKIGAMAISVAFGGEDPLTGMRFTPDFFQDIEIKELAVQIPAVKPGEDLYNDTDKEITTSMPEIKITGTGLTATSDLTPAITGTAGTATGDVGTVTVRLYEVSRINPAKPTFKARYINVNKSVVKRGGKTVYQEHGALWVSMIQKAYAAGGFTGEGTRNLVTSKMPGSYSLIDLDLSRYNQIAARFAREKQESTAFLKSGIKTRNSAFNRMIDEIERAQLPHLERLLRRLSRYGDRIAIQLSERLRDVVKIDSSIFHLLLDRPVEASTT